MVSDISRAKYSIIIPCLNSIEYISVTLPLILRSNFDNFEVIVSDNCSSDETAKYLETIHDPRVFKVRPNSRLSMHEHYEFALSHARGDWINLIGADDFPLPSIFSTMEKLTIEFPTTEIFTWNRSYFYWPGVEEVYGDIRLSYTELSIQREWSSRKTLLLGLLGQEQILDLPQLYTCSFVSSKLIKRVKESGGGVFYANSIPDIYSSVELLSASTKFVRIGYPLTLVGSSSSSLGIGDRIYLDHQINNSTKEDLLNEKIDKELHLQKISSYYLLDAYLSYSAKHSLKAKKLFKFLALIGVAGELIRRRVFFESLKLVRRSSTLLDIPTVPLLLALLLSVPNLGIRLLRESLRRLSRRLLRFFGKDSVRIHATATSNIVELEQALDAIAEIRKTKRLR